MLLARANLTLYRLILTLAYPFVRARLWLRARSEPEYAARTEERFGYAPDGVPIRPIWFHTVSAGEAIAAVPLIEAIVARYPDVPVLVTTMTPTGSGEVTKRLGDRVSHCYAPYDFTHGVRRFFERVQPRALVLMETELWPNLIDFAYRAGAPVVLVNARLSKRSAGGYGKIAGLTKDMLGKLALVACQTPAHQQRFEALGARVVEAVGSVKFDASVTPAVREEARALSDAWQLAGRRVWIAASTHPGEDEIVLDAARSVAHVHPSALVIVVPRHPVRADDVVRLAQQRHLTVARQSEIDGPAPQVVVGDVMGSLLMLFGLSEVAFVGGSLVDRGGHNPIEAALWRQPILMGPHVHNFVDVVDVFEESGALQRVSSVANLAATVTTLLSDDDERTERGIQAYETTAANTGAAARQEALLIRELTVVVP